MHSLSNASTSDVRSLSVPRPPMPDSMQAKVHETGYSMNRAISTAHEIINRLHGPALSGQSDMAKTSAPDSLHGDTAELFSRAYELESLLLQIKASVFND